MNKRMECIVYGRVQMVMFRDFTVRKAKSLGIVGEVWNERDKTVRIVAEGEEEALRALLSQVQKGSLLSKVDGVDVSYAPAQGSYETFSIAYD